jgi:restriction system-associated AAA family ATPase
MKLLRLVVNSANSCGGLLDGLNVNFEAANRRSTSNIADRNVLAPHCLIGPNGSGKSQLLQVIAEIFQSAWHANSPGEEREASNNTSLFELDYLITNPKRRVEQVNLKRTRKGRLTVLEMRAKLPTSAKWREISLGTLEFASMLPSIVVGYTSGDNETLSLPFFVSRAGYATAVREAAFENTDEPTVADNRLLLIDYSTHLEVLVANLLLGPVKVRRTILEHARLGSLASFRCVIQLNHLPRLKSVIRKNSDRKGVQLTEELEGYIEAFKAAATCWTYDERREIYILDFLVTEATRDAFKSSFSSSMLLYKAFHKFSLLNDLAIPREARDRLRKDIETRRFASRLPEPQDEEKIFRFEQVRFLRPGVNNIVDSLDYVSLSDGEHQQSQILGVFSMIVQDNALFVLDEPESHFNPKWRVEFVKTLLTIPVERGSQEILLTSHAPFVPSDLRREQVHVFSKDLEGKVNVEPPTIETYGATFDRILDHCFGVTPPISQMARDRLNYLMSKGNANEVKEGIATMGSSFEKAFLIDRLSELENVK